MLPTLDAEGVELGQILVQPEHPRDGGDDLGSLPRREIARMLHAYRDARAVGLPIGDPEPYHAPTGEPVRALQCPSIRFPAGGRQRAPPVGMGGPGKVER